MSTRRRIRLTVAAAAFGLAGLGTTLAHHSQSQFETVKVVSIEGTFTAISWSNPHTLFFLNARPADAANATLQHWEVEGPGPRGLENAGWTKGMSKVGDKVVITGRPRRDGKPELLLTKLVLADGTVFNFKP
ncbi:MAG: DUF6152 family protein [Steroidobacteraceae bacterium]